MLNRRIVNAGILVATMMSSVVAGGGPAAAGDLSIEEYVPTFTRTDAWLHANGSPIGNVDARDGKFLRWDATKPTAGTPAVYSSHNLAFAAGVPDHDPAHFLTMQGTVPGDLNAIAFDLYFKGWAQMTLGCALALSFELKVDGETFIYQGATGGSNGISYRKVDDTTHVARFALTNLWGASKEYATKYGPDVTHNVYLSVQNFYLCNELTWLYDGAATPSGFVVNLPEPGKKGYTEIDVLDPPPPPG